MIGFGSAKPSETANRYLLQQYLPPTNGKLTLTRKRLDWEINDPFEIYSRLYQQFENSFILESSAGPEELAKNTFIGFNPRAVLSFNEGTLKVNGTISQETRDPLLHLKNLEESFEEYSTPDPGKYLGGLVGYTGYDLIRYVEDLPEGNSGRSFPELQAGLYLDGLIHNSQKDTLTYFSYTRDRSSQLRERLASSPGGENSELELRELKSDFKKEEFTEAVKEARDYIYSGDIYQTVLSRELTGKFDGDPFEAYRKLREINPSPYMYHLKFGDKRIIGSSPEKLVSVNDGKVTTYPIAGTRPLGNSERERNELKKDLLSDDKERAEHNMLVDLARNDVGRVADYGTVDIPQFMEVREFSHVQHIVSKVTGQLASGRTALDGFESVFPAGTVSGAPKVRAMELIDELEVSRRGPYAGAVGYLSLTGDFDTCITIRSLFTDARRLTLRAGAGIVADSDPAAEWEEINHKLAAMKSAVSGGGPDGVE